MSEDPRTRASKLAERLTQQGHKDHAEKVETALAHETEHAVLLGLRDFCQTLLTWVEAFDPVTIGMAEELRLAVDHDLGLPPPASSDSDSSSD